MKKYELSAWGRTFEVTLSPTEYSSNGNLAVCMDEVGEGPYATITVNLGKLNFGFAYIDVNNCPWAEAFLEKYGLAKFTGKTCISGFCEYPLYEFDMDKLIGGMVDD